MKTSTSKDLAWSGPCASTKWYSGGSLVICCTISWRRDLGSWGTPEANRSSISLPRIRRISCSAASKPLSAQTAPIKASKASARMESRSYPPLDSSPLPSLRCSPNPRPREILARACPRTKDDRSLVNSPSLSSGHRRKSSDATQAPKMASPRNSRRSYEAAGFWSGAASFKKEG